jgi:glycosyltransferase involved in cell wall biosynthesis
MGLPQSQHYYPKVPHIQYEEFVNHVLFSEKRLQGRLIFFKELTLKSILNQTYKNFEWIIFISNFLPEKYKEYIKNIDSRIKVVELDGKGMCQDDLLKSHNPSESDYISCRLDDDDGLCVDYFELLNKAYNNHEIDFVAGSKESLGISYEKEKFLYSKLKTSYLTSAGVACKNKHIYSIGSHSRIQANYKIKLISEYRRYPCVQATGQNTFTNRKHVQSTNDFDMNLYMSEKLNLK